MVKNYLIVILIGLIIGGAIIWRAMPPKEKIVEKPVFHYDTSYQTITKTVIKIVYRDSIHLISDTVLVALEDTFPTHQDTIKIPDTIFTPTKKWSAVPMVGYTGGFKTGVGVGFKDYIINYEYNFGQKCSGIYLQKKF